MKKFTFLFSFLIIAGLLNGQTIKIPESKIRLMQERYSRITQQNNHLKRHLLNQTSKNSNLKSAAATIALDSIVFLVPWGEPPVWTKDTKDEFIYNDQFQNTAWIEKEWNRLLNTWEDVTHTELKYDTESRISEMIIHSAEEPGGEMVPENRIMLYYSSEGVLDSLLHYLAQSDESWMLEARQINIYDENGKLINTDFISLEEDEEYGIQILRIKYTYTNSGEILKSDIYFISDDDEFHFSANEYSYDAQGRRITSQFSSFNIMTFEVEPVELIEYEYNAMNDVLTEITSIWDDTEWVHEQKMEYVYNDFDFSDIIFPSYFSLLGFTEEISVSKAIAEINRYTMEGDTWASTGKSLYYYSDKTLTNVSLSNISPFLIYPNPATENIFIKWDGYHQLSLQIYQVTGAKSMEIVVSPGKEISVSHLQKGLYIYKLLNGRHTVHSGKLILK
jgi:hypothetical protein